MAVERMIPRREIPAAIRRITGGAKNPHEQTIRRWYSRGIRGVRLEVTYVGGEVFTTWRQIHLFLAQVKISAEARRRVRNQHQQPAESDEPTPCDTRRARMFAQRVLARLGAAPPRRPRPEPVPVAEGEPS